MAMASPVVLVHGLRGSSTEWKTLREFLEAHGHPVIALDLPGHGTQALGWVLDSYRIASTTTHHMLPDGRATMSSVASSTFMRAGSSGEVAPSEHFADTLRQLDALDTRQALSRLQVPVWLLNGQWDRFRMQEREFLRAARTSGLVRQPGVRLAARFRHPVHTARLLLGILDGRHPTRSRSTLLDR